MSVLLPPVHDAWLARQFRLRRLGVRACFLFGLALVAVATPVSGASSRSTPRGVALVLGLVLLGATFPLYALYANRCPGCRRPFSETREFDGSETKGLPLFNTIRECPACGLVLRGDS